MKIKNIVHRAFALLLVLCTVVSLLPAFVSEAEAASWKGSDFTSGILADRLNTIINKGITSDVSSALPAVGGKFSSKKLYTVKLPTRKWGGYQCVAYAYAAYNYLFDADPYKNSSVNFPSLTAKSTLSYKDLSNAGVKFGAYLRTTKNSNGKYHASNGHSLLILSYDQSKIVTLEANRSSSSQYVVEIRSRSWKDFNKILSGSKRYVSWLCQPKSYDKYGLSTPHTDHVKGAFQYYVARHPHYNFYKCSVCGELFTDGSKKSYLESCETCNPKLNHTAHVKGEFRFYEKTHPHYNYYKCSVCGELFTDGTTSKMPSCKTCYPEKKEWTPWSSWSTTKVTASSTRQVQTRQVQTAAAYTQYRYGRYVNPTGKHDCWCSKYLESLNYGKASLQYSSWSTARYSPTGKAWTCGKCSAKHIGVNKVGSDGRSWWAEYKLSNGSYYWEESRTVPAVYVTQYRYRDYK